MAGAVARMSRRSCALGSVKPFSRRFAAFLQASRRALARSASSGSSPPPRSVPRRGNSIGRASRRASQPSAARFAAPRSEEAVSEKLGT